MRRLNSTWPLKGGSVGKKCPDYPVSTPALIVDEQTMEENLARAARYALQHGVSLRPHVKTHRSLALAHRQMERGALGLAAAQVGELEVIGAAADDLLLTSAVIDPRGCRRLSQLARRATVRVVVDSRTSVIALQDAARQAAATIGVLIELDVGLRETGVQSPQQALELARCVWDSDNLRLDGLLFYVGPVSAAPLSHLQHLARAEEQVMQTLELWRAAGLQANIISAGGSLLLAASELPPSVTELRLGHYIFWDATAVAGGYCTDENCAARVLATVVSNSVSDQVVVNAGSRALSTCVNDRNYGIVVEYPEARLRSVSEIHSQLDVSACPQRPRIGEQVTIIPSQIISCVNLQERLWLRRQDGSLEQIPIDARGDA
jgi:D-serine deaminase-like pyridoxal phosphate-dependent protein